MALTAEQRKANSELRKTKKLELEEQQRKQREAEELLWAERKELEWFKTFFELIKLDKFLRSDEDIVMQYQKILMLFLTIWIVNSRNVH